MSTNSTGLSWAYVVNSKSEHAQTVFLLHAEGSGPKDLMDNLFGANPPDLLHRLPSLKWVFLRAPGYSSVHSSLWWYQLPKHSCHTDSKSSQRAIARCAAPLQALIQQEAEVIGTSNIFLGGMDQGALVALYALIGQPERLAGFIAFDGMTTNNPIIPRKPYGVGPPKFQLTTPVLVARNIDPKNTSGFWFVSYLEEMGMLVKSQTSLTCDIQGHLSGILQFMKAYISSDSNVTLPKSCRRRSDLALLSPVYDDPVTSLNEPLKSQMLKCLREDAEREVLGGWSSFMSCEDEWFKQRLVQQELQKSLVWCWREAAGWPEERPNKSDLV